MSRKQKKSIKELQKTLQPGDIVLYGPKEVSAKGIAGAFHRAFNAAGTRLQGDFLHSGMYLGGGKTIESFAGKGTGEHKFSDMAEGRKITIVRPKLSMKTKLKAVENAKKMQGNNYSLASLGYAAKNLLLPKKAKNDLKRTKDPKSFNCATLITNAYRKAGAKVVDTDIDMAAPVELVSSRKNKMVFISDAPDESLVITQAGRKASKKAKRFLKGLKVAGSVSYSSSHSESNINGDVSFSGHRLVSNGKRKGLKYKGSEKDGLLSARLEKMGAAITPAMLQTLGYRARDAYTYAAGLNSAGYTSEDLGLAGSKIKQYSTKKYQEIKSKGHSKTAGSQEVYSDSKLKIIAHPDACNWMPSQEIIVKLGHFLHKPMCIRIFPRDMVFEVYDSEHPCPLNPEDYYKFRAYTSGSKATVFVDDTETKESALWVILHELAHMDMKASPYLFKAYTLATPPDYNESDEAHERDPEEKMANLVATKWLGQCGCEEVEYARPWWRARVNAKCSMEKDAGVLAEHPDYIPMTDKEMDELWKKGLSFEEMEKIEAARNAKRIHGPKTKTAGAGLVFAQKYYEEHPKLVQSLLKKIKQRKMTKEAANVVALAAGVAVGSVAVYDYFKSRGMGVSSKTVEEEISKNQVDSKKYIRSKDPRIIAVTNMAEARPMLSEIKNTADRGTTKRQLQSFFANKEVNAFAYRGKKEYVITHRKCNRIALDHEIGHIHDFRSQNLTMSGKNKYSEKPLQQFLFKKNYQEGMYQAEVAAWDKANIPKSNKLRSAALDTYDKSFHKNRMSVAAPTAVGLLLYGAN